MFRDAQQARLPMFGDALNKRKTEPHVCAEKAEEAAGCRIN